ncbi:MAG: ribosome maturation factor RimP [Chryseolinea sp.]
MELAEEIRKIAEDKLNNPAHFVVDVVVSLRGQQKVIIVLDGDEGITIDNCADLSREISKDLDALTTLKDSYMLEVSTPGLDQPIALKRQYVKNIGRRLKVKLADSTLEGKLMAVGEDRISVEIALGEGKKKEIKTVEIQFTEIDKSFVLVSFK